MGCGPQPGPAVAEFLIPRLLPFPFLRGLGAPAKGTDLAVSATPLRDEGAPDAVQLPRV